MNKSTITTPIINIIQNNKMDSEKYLNTYLNLYPFIRDSGLDLVTSHKVLFGLQNYCSSGFCYRHWVWEKTIGNIGWRVYINNRRGIGFEVHENCSHKEAIKMFNDYASCVFSMKKER